MINRDELLKMARDAGFEVCKDRKGIEQAWVEGVLVTPDVEELLNAILERAAVECDHAELHNDSDQLKNSDPRKTCGNAIRALKTQ